MIDWTRMDTLRDEIGADCLQEVVDLFIEEIDESIARLRAGPVSDLGAELHFLKGGALNLGFNEFAALCQQGEGACSDGKADQVNLSAILASYAASRAAFLHGRAG